MANRTYLLASDTLDPPSLEEPADALLSANYSIPILWLSLFTIAQRVPWPDGDGNTYSGLVGRRDECVERSTQRINAWGVRWGWVDPSDPIPSQWLEFLATIDSTFLSVWTVDLAIMYPGDTAWAADLDGWLAGMDEPHSGSFNAALKQSYLKHDVVYPNLVRPVTSEPIGVAAAGYPVTATTPWA